MLRITFAVQLQPISKISVEAKLLLSRGKPQLSKRTKVKSKVLVVGGTGYIGRRIVKASLELGHQTFVVMRPEVRLDIKKFQALLSFKMQGTRLVEGPSQTWRASWMQSGRSTSSSLPCRASISGVTTSCCNSSWLRPSRRKEILRRGLVPCL
ncbi:hypothetical protein MLD38_037769 [Melastoma candidum]|uniref:Uncharacterized protein n=1 Tax=Melastoma candidum TaxID=119954 RepID=A0ACB9LPS6_9MYRT|nr:hypothetical protein MLD38_037769 [Melastoma candidum]